MTATLFLIPTPLGNTTAPWLLHFEHQQITHITHFVVEAPKTARKHLKALGIATTVQQLSIRTLNTHTQPQDIPPLLDPLLAGHDVGLLSEAGCPAIADPGAQLVALAHEQDIRIIPLIGPCSILLALMSAGVNSQRFAFHGYLPIATADRVKMIRSLEQRSYQNDETQIFIETPYRNNQLLVQLRQTLNPSTRLAVACDLTLTTQRILSRCVALWPQETLDLHKRPAIFIFYAGVSSKT